MKIAPDNPEQYPNIQEFIRDLEANVHANPLLSGPTEKRLAHIVGKNVGDLLEKSDLTKKRLALMLGIGRPTLDRVINGAADPRLSLLARIADIFEVDVKYLITLHL